MDEALAYVPAAVGFLVAIAGYAVALSMHRNRVSLLAVRETDGSQSGSSGTLENKDLPDVVEDLEMTLEMRAEEEQELEGFLSKVATSPSGERTKDGAGSREVKAGSRVKVAVKQTKETGQVKVQHSKRSGATLFERMAQLSRGGGAMEEDEAGAVEESKISIPRFLSRQNHQ